MDQNIYFHAHLQHPPKIRVRVVAQSETSAREMSANIIPDIFGDYWRDPGCGMLRELTRRNVNTTRSPRASSLSHSHQASRSRSRLVTLANGSRLTAVAHSLAPQIFLIREGIA